MLRMSQQVNILGAELENSSIGDALHLSTGVNYSPNFMQRVSFRFAYDYYYFRTEAVFTGEQNSHSLSAATVGLFIDIN